MSSLLNLNLCRKTWFLLTQSYCQSSDVVRDRPDKKSILLYVSNLYNKLAPGVSHVTVQRNGARTMERSEYTHTVSKRTVNSTYHTEHTVKHVKKGYDEREPVRYVTTTCTTVKEPPIQHSAITTVVSLSKGCQTRIKPNPYDVTFTCYCIVTIETSSQLLAVTIVTSSTRSFF